MQEITLSTNLAQIELEISHHKQIAGQSIWEIGRRLNHVKENDLAHGQFMQWLQKVGIERTEAHRMMKVANELPNVATLQHLGTTALHLIATLPDEAKQEQLERIEQGDSPTVRELQEVKRQLKQSSMTNELLRAENEELKTKSVEVKVVEREVVPEDYRATQKLNIQLKEENLTLKERAEAADNRAKFTQQQLDDLYKRRAEVEENSAKYQELTRAIENSKGILNEQQAKIGHYKNLLSFLKKGNDMVLHMGGLIYIDEERILNGDPAVKREFTQLLDAVNRLADDMNRMVDSGGFIEGEIL